MPETPERRDYRWTLRQTWLTKKEKKGVGTSNIALVARGATTGMIGSSLINCVMWEPVLPPTGQEVALPTSMVGISLVVASRV